MHRDLKAENILIHKENEITYIKISDYGCSRVMGNVLSESVMGTFFHIVY
jgi:serine/threonine protein kinase